MSNKKKPWGGRFDSRRNAAFDRMNASIVFDWRLAAYDLWQNRIYADELTRIGVLSKSERKLLTGALATVASEIQGGHFAYKLSLEDVHMNIEARLTELAGDAGKRIHTGRSRNDQVATDFRLWLRDGIDVLSSRLRDLIETTLTRAEQWAGLAIPGYTHLQRAQVVTFGHHIHAYAEMLLRDLQRLADVRARLNFCPLGSGALASSPYPIDRARLAKAMGFAEATRNSMDAVSDRDFAFEFLAATSLLGLHLSRWAEDITLWMSSEFRWVKLPDAFCTGSSIMPQKKNPDLAELARGKSGRLLGHVVALGTVLKGLPLTYNKDLQEDKEPVFDAYATAYDLVDTWQQMVAEMQVNANHMAAGFKGGHLLATDLADFLVREKDVPFREAHHIVGTAVALAEKLGCDVSDLSLKQLKEIDGRLDKAAKLALRIETSLNSRARFGGPAPAQVAKNIAATRAALSAVPAHDPVFSWAFDLPLPSFLP